MPKVFGWEHIVYLVIVLSLMVAGTFFIKKYVKTEKTLDLIIKILAGFLLAFILFNRISIAAYANNWLQLIPDSFCGMSSLVYAICLLVLKKESIVFHFITYLAFLGGLLTIVYPDFIGQAASIFFPKTISGLLHHTVLLYLSVLTVVTGRFKPELKKIYALPLGLCTFLTFGMFLISALKYGNAMYINKPLIPGTILTWWFVGIVFVAATALGLFIYECIKKHAKKPKMEQLKENE